MIAFILGMVAMVTILYSIYEMKEIVKSDKKESNLRHLIAGQKDINIIFKFFKKMAQNENGDLKKQYLKISFFFVTGIVLFLCIILFELLFE